MSPAGGYCAFTMLYTCRIWISITQLILKAKGQERGGPSGQRNLHPLRLIEQISYEQLLPVKMTRFHFIATDKRSDGICILQLSAILKLADSCFPIYHDKHNYLNISFYGFYKSPGAQSMQSVHQLQPRSTGKRIHLAAWTFRKKRDL